jgi:hypothetical protein
MKGWQTRTFPERVCTHHRKMGSAESGTLEIAFKRGMADYQLGVHPLWEVCRMFYQMIARKPLIVGGAVRLVAFFWAMARRKPKVIRPDVEAFRQHEQMVRLRMWLP